MKTPSLPTLWGRASSVNVQKVMWALAECGIDHERIDAGGMAEVFLARDTHEGQLVVLKRGFARMMAEPTRASW